MAVIVSVIEFLKLACMHNLIVTNSYEYTTPPLALPVTLTERQDLKLWPLPSVNAGAAPAR